MPKRPAKNWIDSGDEQRIRLEPQQDGYIQDNLYPRHIRPGPNDYDLADGYGIRPKT